MNSNHQLLLVDHKDQVIGMYGSFKSRSDLYNYLGILINDSDTCVTINYLAFYDSSFSNFENWVNSVILKDKILCIFTCNEQVFKIMVE